MSNFRILYLFLISNSLCMNCPNGWTRVENDCYLYIGRAMAYNEANIECKSFGSEIVSIKNQHQNQMVTDLVYNTWAKNDNIWLGARKLTRTDTDQWVWSDFTEVHYFNWAPKQPNSNGPQYCIQMVRRYKVNYDWPAGTWNDMDCNEKASVLCKTNLAQIKPLQSVKGSEYLKDRSSEENESEGYTLHMILGTILISSLVITILILCFAYFLVDYYMKRNFLNMFTDRINPRINPTRPPNA